VNVVALILVPVIEVKYPVSPYILDPVMVAIIAPVPVNVVALILVPVIEVKYPVSPYILDPVMVAIIAP
jgi:hypothetical protein